MILMISSAHGETVRELYEKAVDAYNQTRYEDAIKSYQDVLLQAPNFAPAYVGIGLSLRAKGADSEEVIHYYKEAVERDPTNLQALEQLGRLYYSLNQYDKAERVFLRCLKINPSFSEVREALAWVYLVGKSKPELAVKHFKASANRDHPEVIYGLGMAYFANNQRVEAMDMMMRLRGLGQTDLASKLETVIRENRRVVLDQEESAATEETSSVKSGVRARLRGRLSDI